MPCEDSRDQNRLIFATGNSGKLREVREMLGSLAIDVQPQSDHEVGEVPETGLTFVENALIKARNAASVTGLPALADDSGLCVSALGGMPGVRSARYAGERATSDDNVNKVLAAMKGQTQRRAWFHCTLVYLRSADDPDPLVSQARWEGLLLPERAGNGGFGYDPVFRPLDESRSAAQLDPAEKNAISHRGKALRAMVPLLRDR